MKFRGVAGAVVGALVVGLLVMPSSSGAIKAGTSCKKVGLQTVDSGRKYTCVKQGKKLVWNKGVVVKAAPVAKPSPSATPTPSASPSATPTPTPTPTKTYSAYELTKLKAYENIRAEAEKDGSNNIKLVYHISDNVPQELKNLYREQAIYSSKLYGTFFNRVETMNIYVYTEMDQEFLKNSDFPRVREILNDVNRWFVNWEAGKMQEHVLGGWAWFLEHKAKFEGHAGVFVYSKSSIATHRKYAIQVMPHEYFHVVQDYFIKRNPKWTDQNSWDNLFAPIFREGSANTISFALSTETKEKYLDLYALFIDEKKQDRSVQLFSTLTSNEAVVKALYSMRTRATSPDAHESSYSVGSLLFEWVIAEYGFDAYRKFVVNQQIGNSFGDNVQASLGISERELYEKAAPHILAAFNGG
jgi:hypothetical protein